MYLPWQYVKDSRQTYRKVMLQFVYCMYVKGVTTFSVSGTRGSLSSKLPVAFILKPKESLLVRGRIVSTTGKFIINIKNMSSLQMKWVNYP